LVKSIRNMDYTLLVLASIELLLFGIIQDSSGAPHVPGRTPHLVSQPIELVVSEGHEARLPCMVDYLEGSVLVWKKNDQIISIGDQIVHKFASKFSIEEVENGNNLIIHKADFTDEAKFSCCISDHSKTELDHNVRVIANDQHTRGGRGEKHPEISGLVNVAEAVTNEIAPSLGKVYFARVPSFYTFTDMAKNNRVLKDQKQLIKHAPKSVAEFLRLLKTYHQSVLTKDDIQEFDEFLFEKKPIQNRHLLRGEHAYSSNLRQSLQSASIINETGSESMEVKSRPALITDANSNKQNEEFTNEGDKEGTPERKQEDMEVQDEENNVADQLPTIADIGEASITQPNEAYFEDVIGMAEQGSGIDEPLQHSQEESFENMDGELRVQNELKFPKENTEIEMDFKTYSDDANGDDESSGYITEEEKKLVQNVVQETVKDILADLYDEVSVEYIDEYSSEASDEYIHKKEVKGENEEEQVKLKDEMLEYVFNEDVEDSKQKQSPKEKKLHKGDFSSPSHMDGNEEKIESFETVEESNSFNQYKSLSSHRYIKENEVGHVDDKPEVATKKSMIPVKRGHHLPLSTLEEFHAYHIISDEKGDSESRQYKHMGESSESLQQKKAGISVAPLTSESIDEDRENEPLTNKQIEESSSASSDQFQEKMGQNSLDELTNEKDTVDFVLKETESKELIKNMDDEGLSSEINFPRMEDETQVADTYRFIQGNTIGHVEVDEKDISTEDKSTILRGPHLVDADLESYGLKVPNQESTVSDKFSKDVDSKSDKTADSKSVNIYQIQKHKKLKDKIKIDADYTIDNNDFEVSGYTTEEDKMDVSNKILPTHFNSEIENDMLAGSDESSLRKSDEHSRKEIIHEYLQKNMAEDRNKEKEGNEHSSDTSKEAAVNYKQKKLPKDGEVSHSSSYTHRDTENNESYEPVDEITFDNQYLSLSSLRFIKENEVGKVEDEPDVIIKKAMVPVKRGQHLPLTTLEEFHAYHIGSDEKEKREQQKLEQSSFSSLDKFQKQEEDNSFDPLFYENSDEETESDSQETKNVEKTSSIDVGTSKKENEVNILKDKSEFENRLVGIEETDVMYPNEIKDIERQFFTKNVQKETSLEGRHPLLVSHDNSENIIDDKNNQNYKSSISEEEESDQELPVKEYKITNQVNNIRDIDIPESLLGRERDDEDSTEDVYTKVMNDVMWYINLPGHYLTGKRYLDDVEDDNESIDDKLEEKTVPLYRGQHQPQEKLEESELNPEMKEKFKKEHYDNTQPSHFINVETLVDTDLSEGGIHPLLYEKNKKQDQVSDHYKNTDSKGMIKTKGTLPKISEKNVDEGKNNIDRKLEETEEQEASAHKMTSEDKKMIPLKAFDEGMSDNENIDAIYSKPFKNEKKKDRWDGPHPFRSICRLLKCL